MTFHRGLMYGGFGWCLMLLAIPPLRGVAVGLIVSLFVLEAAFVISVRSLFVNGRVPLALGLMQLAVFAAVPSQVVASLGPRHYDAEPSMAGWAGFAAVHTVRAADIADALEESGVRVQPVRHQSTLSALLIIGLHVTVDLMVLGAVVGWVSRRWKGAKAWREASRGYIDGAFVLCLVAIFHVAWWQGWRTADWILWPLDNVLRVIDIGDAMQVFGWRLHAVEPSVGVLVFAVVFRIITALVLAGFFVYLRVALFRGFGMTAEDYVELLDRDERNHLARLAAIEALAALPPDVVVPRMLAAAADPKRADGARDVLERMGPRLGRFVPTLLDAMRSPSPGLSQAAAAGLSGAKTHATEAIPSLIALLKVEHPETRHLAFRTLEVIDPQWESWPEAHAVVPELIGMFRDGLDSLEFGELGRICRLLDAIEPGWTRRPETLQAAERLVAKIAGLQPHSWECHWVAELVPYFGPVAADATVPLLKLFASGTLAPRPAQVALDAVCRRWRELPSVLRLRERLFRTASIGPLTAGGSWEADALDVIDPRWPERVDTSRWKRDLLNMVLSPDQRERSAAFRVIERFGKAVANLAEPLAGIARTDPDARRAEAAADALSRLAKWQPNVCLPVMLRLLGGDHVAVAIAFRGLADMAEHAGPGVPAMTRLLDDAKADRHLVLGALRILAVLGPAARSAAPTLAALLDSPDIEIRDAAWMALRQIDGEALAWLDGEEVTA